MAGPRKLRQCVGCNEFRCKQQLLRIVSNKTAGIHLDRIGNAAGRGAYVCPNPECIENAIRRRGFVRSLHTEIPQDVVSDLYKEIQIDSE